MQVNPHNSSSASQLISNSSAVKINKSPNNKEQLNNEMERLAKDIYHKDMPKEPEATYYKPINKDANILRPIEDVMYDIGVATAHLYMPGGDVPKTVEKMLSPYDSIMAELKSEQPALANKSWGIAINESGELVVTGSVNDDEKALIAEKLNSNEELVTAVNDFKSNYLKYIKMEPRGWGNYDVNESNFAEVFDFREMLETSRSSEDFKGTWDYETNWLKLNDNVSAQLRSNASKR
ncbi:hypothetical protein [Pseudoalteromonas prydzensis]|uniref:hypothetical protein n=2 Tax=Gammaproteobacteria TaxID=1236 RepID=UPI0007E50164|nr:hypothetical protein [Pseudoalteromonas prydzensis]MBE0379643.1 hypothetical protein [Pseudoalteromonas prydzensis ACAM 620]